MRERRKRLKVVVVMITDHSVNLVKMIEEARGTQVARECWVRNSRMVRKRRGNEMREDNGVLYKSF